MRSAAHLKIMLEKMGQWGGHLFALKTRNTVMHKPPLYPNCHAPCFRSPAREVTYFCCEASLPARPGEGAVARSGGYVTALPPSPLPKRHTCITMTRALNVLYVCYVTARWGKRKQPRARPRSCQNHTHSPGSDEDRPHLSPLNALHCQTYFWKSLLSFLHLQD